MVSKREGVALTDEKFATEFGAESPDELRIAILKGAAEISDKSVALLSSQTPSLLRINLSGCTGLTDRSLIILSKHANNLLSIKFKISGVISEDATKSLNKFHNLEKIDLTSFRVHFEDLRIFLKSTPSMFSLKVSSSEYLTEGQIYELFKINSRLLRVNKYIKPVRSPIKVFPSYNSHWVHPGEHSADKFPDMISGNDRDVNMHDQVVKYVDKDILSTPLKELNIEELTNLIRTLNT
jgi:hypothetical protein